MEGLVKGLLDVALGGGNNRDDNNDQGTDQRSRSTTSWANVSF